MPTDGSRNLPKDINQLNDWLEEQSQAGQLPVTVIPIVCNTKPQSLLTRDSNILVSDKGEWAVADFLPLYYPVAGFGQPLLERAPGGTVIIVPTDYPGVWVVYSTSKTSFIKRVQSQLRLHGKSIPPFSFSNNELSHLLDRIVSSNAIDDIVSTQTSLRSHTGETSTIRKHYSYSDVFSLAANLEATVQTLRLVIDGHFSVNTVLFREGSTRVAPGSWKGYKSCIHDLLLEAIGLKLSQLRNRYRTSFEQLGRPVYLRYQHNVFKTRNDNIDLVKALHTDGTNLVTVRHLNPYLHASITDLVEGGQFDVFVTSQDTITIVPGYSATEGALLRIINAIFDHMREGAELSEKRDGKQLTFKDVMGAAQY